MLNEHMSDLDDLLKQHKVIDLYVSLQFVYVIFVTNLKAAPHYRLYSVNSLSTLLSNVMSPLQQPRSRPAPFYF